MPFTDRQIAALKPKGQRYEKKEPGRTGLGIRVTPKGRRTWTFIYRYSGEQRRLVLGSYPAMGVAKAHKALADAKDKLELGLDPGAEVAGVREIERNAETVADLVDEYLERHARKKMSATTAAEDERVLRRDVIPEIGKLKAKEVTRRDLIRVLDVIEDRGASVLRNRVASVFSRLFMFALDRGVVEASPAVRIRRLEETSRDRFLSVAEIRSFWHGLDDADVTDPVRIALRFLLVTGQRRTEVAVTARTEIDDDEKLWHLPAARAKNGRDNLVPLPPLAWSLIEAADATRTRREPRNTNRKDRNPYDPAPSPWLFPSFRHSKSIGPHAITKALNRNREALAIGDARVHDLRRTFATWHGEMGTPAPVLSALLNHAPSNITDAVYNRATNIEPRRQAMQVWCEWLQRVIAGEQIDENVVRLSRSPRSARD